MTELTPQQLRIELGIYEADLDEDDRQREHWETIRADAERAVGYATRQLGLLALKGKEFVD